jgi:acyl-CoA thioester hydrolase
MEININSYNFKHKTNVQVRFNDIDIVGHVNNAIYQYYYDFGKLKFMNSVFENIINWNESGFVLLNINIDYISPIYLNDNIIVETRIDEIKNKSIVIQQIIREQGSENEKGVKSVAKSVMVAYNFTTKESIEIPNEWRQKMKLF